MARKVFITVLGTGFYGKCKYQLGDFISNETRFIQQAMLEYFAKKGSDEDKWVKEDLFLFLLTERAKTENWEVENNKRATFCNKEEVEYIGLKQIIDGMKLVPTIETKDIPDGKNEKEMWDIFDIVFNSIKDGDELYFDLTHSFRYLPMLILVLGNYAKFLKKVTIKGISYGNYEARDRNKNIAPIVDLMPIAALQDWTYAAGQYLHSGNVENLVELSSKTINPILSKTKGADQDAQNLKKFVTNLKNVVEERRTCRGISIVKSENFQSLKTLSDNMEETFISPLNPVFDKIKDSLKDFDEDENIMNGFAAAKWCLDNGLYQQAATILQESIDTLICMNMGIDWQIEKEREVANIAFNVAIPNLPEEKWNLKLDEKATREEIEKRKQIIKDILNNGLFKNLINSYNAIKTLRNDFNHAGMRNCPMSSQSIKNNIGDLLNQVKIIITPVLINLSNHPCEGWSSEQLQAAQSRWGKVVDMAFPNVDADGDEHYIATLAEATAEQVEKLAQGQFATVHVMGEMTLTMALVARLKQRGMPCVASTSKRIVTEVKPGEKVVKFQFERFRAYE